MLSRCAYKHQERGRERERAMAFSVFLMISQWTAMANGGEKRFSRWRLLLIFYFTNANSFTSYCVIKQTNKFRSVLFVSLNKPHRCRQHSSWRQYSHLFIFLSLQQFSFVLWSFLILIITVRFILITDFFLWFWEHWWWSYLVCYIWRKTAKIENFQLILLLLFPTFFLVDLSLCFFFLHFFSLFFFLCFFFSLFLFFRCSHISSPLFSRVSI